MSHSTRNRYHHISHSLKKLARCVGHKNCKSIASAAVGNMKLRPHVVEKLARSIRMQELVPLCSDKHDSILRLKSKPALEHFSWETVWEELRVNAPLLLSFFSCLLPKRKQQEVHPAICMLASIVLRLNNQKVNLVQSVVSLILRAGHATKQVRSASLFSCGFQHFNIVVCTCTWAPFSKIVYLLLLHHRLILGSRRWAYHCHISLH